MVWESVSVPAIRSSRIPILRAQKSYIVQRSSLGQWLVTFGPSQFPETRGPKTNPVELWISDVMWNALKLTFLSHLDETQTSELLMATSVCPSLGGSTVVDERDTVFPFSETCASSVWTIQGMSCPLGNPSMFRDPCFLNGEL